MAARPPGSLALLLLLLAQQFRPTASKIGCDGTPEVKAECILTDESTATLTYCECNSCQTYDQSLVYGGTPPAGPGVAMSWLIPGVQSNHTLCLHHWTWLKVPTTRINDDGEIESMGVVFHLDTAYDNTKNRFTSVDVLEVANGELPTNWWDVHSGQKQDGSEELFYPYEIFGLGEREGAFLPLPYMEWGSREGNGRRMLFKQDSYMYTSGYDENGEGCRGSQPEFLYFGVRCGDEADPTGWNFPELPCIFTARVDHLEYELKGGSNLEKVPIQQGTTHFYWMHAGPAGEKGRLPCSRTPPHQPAWWLPRSSSLLVPLERSPQQLGGLGWPQELASGRPGDEDLVAILPRPQVGDYDVVRILFARQGNNLTAPCGDHAPDCVQTNGHGLIGFLRFDVDSCPYGGRTRDEYRLANESTQLTLEWFCTQGGEGGRYTLGLEADPLFDPAGGAPGYEYPDGSKAAGQTEQLAFNPGGMPNQLRAARGYYRISVFHLTFDAGPISVGERRAGCVSYSQWRHFTLVTYGADDASLVAKLEARTEEGEVLGGMPLSGLYVRRNKQPDYTTYDARALHPTDEVTVSPCDVDEPRQWHLSVHMDFELKANSVGLYRGYFVLAAVTESGYGATYDGDDWPAENAPPRVFVLPRAQGGTGHTCCGQTKLWVLRNVPSQVGLQVDVNVSKGRARALLLNRGTCPSQDPKACAGLCSLTKLVAYNPYTRGAQYALSGSVLSTMVGVDEAPVADWLVGVQALDEGASIEVSLRISSVQRSRSVGNYTCNRLEHFCPQQQRLENVTGYSAKTGDAVSAASHSGPGRWAAWAAAWASSWLAVRCQRRSLY